MADDHDRMARAAIFAGIVLVAAAPALVALLLWLVL